jgi:predicted TIM-barrel fold metal-dependent hydrolase
MLSRKNDRREEAAMPGHGTPSRSAEIRAKLDHPIIDADGHLREFHPLYMAFVRQVAGPRLAARVEDRFKASALGFALKGGDLYGVLQDPRDPKRQDWRTPRGVWFGAPTMDPLDAATPYLPKLLHERMDEIGLDFAILYPGLGLSLPHEPDEEIRRATIRSLNTYFSETTRDYADRMTMAAVIPMHTPEEAIAELDHAVGTLGAKVIMIPPGVLRPIPAIARTYPGAFPEAGGWVDSYALDSLHDYDPVWQRCIDLRVAVTCHGGMVPNTQWNGRSLSNFCFNHIGNMALQQHGICKSLFMGGVTRRFPKLKFAFLECGVAWACMLYAELIGHWEKRNLAALPLCDPANLDRSRHRDLLQRYGGRFMEGLLDRPDLSPAPPRVTDPVLLDEWRALAIETADEFKPLFTENFHFGCEADDPTTAWGFDAKVNPFGARLKAMLGSDVGHFDLPQMTKVLAEAYELVERELITPDEFRDYTFTHAASAHLAMNPDFFRGTRVANAVDAALGPAKRAKQ